MCTISTPKKWSKSRQKVEKTRAKRWKNRKSEKNVFFSTFSKCQKMTNLCIFVHTCFFSKNPKNPRVIPQKSLIDFLIINGKMTSFCGYTPLFPVWKGESLENTRENSLSWSNPYYCRSNRVVSCSARLRVRSPSCKHSPYVYTELVQSFTLRSDFSHSEFFFLS